MNFEKFTIKSQEALQKAAELALGAQQQAIEPAHLLKALLETDANVVGYLAAKLNVSRPMLDSRLQELLDSYARVSGSQPYLSSGTNAVLQGGLAVRMRDDDPDYPAMVVANHLLGGSSTARLPARIREKEGLSYSTYTWFSASSFEQVANFGLSAIFAPQNRERVERAVREELARAVREGFSEDEIRSAVTGLLESRRVARSQDPAIAARLGSLMYAGRDFLWERDLDARIAALKASDVNTALKRHLDPARLSIVRAGDFKP